MAVPDPHDMADAAPGWTVRTFDVLASTNDEAARHRDAGASRVAVVARVQTAGRGRAGRAFASPPGGLYASLVVRVAPRDLGAPLVAAAAVALHDAVTDVLGALRSRHGAEAPPPTVSIKWPNDLWIDRRKVAGILLEAASPSTPGLASAAGTARDEVGATIGVGVNVEDVPRDLSTEVAQATTALARHAGPRVGDAEGWPSVRGRLLASLLGALDRRLEELGSPAGRRALASAYLDRLALRGERVRFVEAGAPAEGVLRGAGLDGDLEFEDERGPRVLRGAHVSDLRPSAATGP